MEVEVFLLVGYAVLGLGALLFAVAIFSAASKRQKYAAWCVAQGNIVDLATEAITPGNMHYYPVIEFKGPDHGLLRFQSHVGSYPRKPEIGKVLKIIYNPTNPSEAEINSLAALWLPQLVSAGLGLISLLVGALFVGLASQQMPP